MLLVGYTGRMTPYQESVQRVKDHLRASILRAELPEGAAVREEMLRSETGASVRAVKQALRELAGEGLIRRKRHAGTRVAERLPSVICAVLPPVRSVSVISALDEKQLTRQKFSAAVLAGIREKLSAPPSMAFLTNPAKKPKSLDDVPPLDVEEQKRSVQGLISIEANNATTLNQLVRAGLLVVSVDFAVPDGLFDMVAMDHLHHGFQATWHLLELGHRRIAFLGERPSAHSTDPSWQDRFAGYLKAMAIHGGETPQMWVQSGERSTLHLSRELAKFHRAYKPTAYVLATGGLAPTCREIFERMSLSVPRDISLAAADNACEGFARMRVTRIFADYAELGRTAVRLLAARLACRPMPQVRTVLQGRFTPGDTTAPPRQA